MNPKATQCNATQQCNNNISETKIGGTSATQFNTLVLEGNFTRNKPKCNTTVQQEGFREIPWRNKCNTMQHNSATCKFY